VLVFDIINQLQFTGVICSNHYCQLKQLGPCLYKTISLEDRHRGRRVASILSIYYPIVLTNSFTNNKSNPRVTRSNLRIIGNHAIISVVYLMKGVYET